jgi:hypothetical protein
MAYFNHSFTKGFLGTKKLVDNTKTSAALATVGEVAFVNSNYKVMDLVDLAAHAGGFYIAQASFQTNDKIGNNPGHGGYAESSKSKMIMKKYISDMWISTCEDESAAQAVIEIKPTEADKSCFPCGSDPIFRVDIKGTAALRLLNHNAYASLSGSLPMLQTGQMPAAGGSTALTHPANGVDMCCRTQDADHSGIAPSIVAANLRDQFNNDPILSTFGVAQLKVSVAGAAYANPDISQENAIYAGGALGVANMTNAATGGSGAVHDGTWRVNDTYKVEIKLKTSCELQTQFSSCSFDTRDFYLMGGLKASVDLQDEVGNPCVACQGFVIQTTTDFKQRRTSAETAARDILLTERYRQSPYNQGNKDSARFREIEQMAGIVDAVGRDATDTNCKGKYKVYSLLHTVPRFNNPSGVFDNDQYLYRVYAQCNPASGSDAEAAVTFLNTAWLELAIDAGVHRADGSGVVTSVADLETKGGNY